MNDTDNFQQQDELSIVANGQSISGWQSISLTRSIESFPSNFQLAFTEKYPKSGSDIAITPGTSCTVKIGADTVLTGYIDGYASSISPNSHDVSINGRSKCEDLVDCSGFFGREGEAATPVYGQNITQIATALCAPFGIKVSNRSEDGPTVNSLIINLGESPYEIIEKVARWVGLLVYDDTNGNLILDRVGSQQMGSGFEQGINVQTASVAYRADQRFSDYYVVWQATNSFNDLGVVTGNGHGYAEDSGMRALGRFRPHYIVSALVDADLGDRWDLGQRIADWECNRRFGRSQSVTVVTDSWRDKNGKLWECNAFVTVDIPAIKAGSLNWVIGSVTFQRSLEAGNTAQLVLYPEEAFRIEPLALASGDADLIQRLRQGQADNQPTGRTVTDDIRLPGEGGRF